jgi:hypothetical protein
MRKILQKSRVLRYQMKSAEVVISNIKRFRACPMPVIIINRLIYIPLLSSNR